MNFGFKLRHILWPLLLQTAIFLLVYTTAFWLIVSHWKLFDPSTELLFWGPMALSALTVIALLRPRLKLLHIGERARTLYYLIPVGIQGLGAMFSAEYLTQATGSLAAVASPAELVQQPAARFYSLRQAYIHKPGLGVHTTFMPTGRYRENIEITVHVACPVLNSAADTVRHRARLWLAWEQRTTISSHATTTEKDARYQAFLHHCDSLFQLTDLNSFRYLEQATAATHSRELRTAAQRSSFYEAAGEPIIVHPHNEVFTGHTAPLLGKLAWTIGIGLGLYAVLLLFPAVASTEAEYWVVGHRPPGLLAQMAPYVLPRPRYVATPLLVFANAAVYVAMVLTGLGVIAFQRPGLLNWGASYGPAVAAGEWWRLLTSAFVHGGLFHLLNNLVTLGLLSWLLEQTLGTGRLLALYLLAAVGAGLVSLWWQPDSVSVGASGAIFGLVGAGLALAFSHRVPEEDRGSLLLFSLLFGGISLVIGFFLPGTDNAAHVGGLLAGLVLGAVMARMVPPPLMR